MVGVNVHWELLDTEQVVWGLWLRSLETSKLMLTMHIELVGR
jgi:hypothetical protein